MLLTFYVKPKVFLLYKKYILIKCYDVIYLSILQLYINKNVAVQLFYNICVQYIWKNSTIYKNNYEFPKILSKGDKITIENPINI